MDPLAYQTRSKSSVNDEVAVKVAIPTIAEAQAIYGVDLAAKGIQAVWLEVKNGGTAPYWFLPSGLDPNYFSPSEAAFAFRTGSKKSNRQLDDKFQELQFFLDPYVDQARNDLTQDLAYSQALIKIGYVKGAGRPQSTKGEEPANDLHYITDGLRVVRILGDRPVSLATIDFFDWERLANSHKDK